MEGACLKTLVLVGTLSTFRHGTPSQEWLTYSEAVKQGVVIYNSKAKEDYLYRLLVAVPPLEWDHTSVGTQELKFTIKETVCPAGAEGFLDECDFKKRGVIRQCTANFFLGQEPPLAVLTCTGVACTTGGEEEGHAESWNVKEVLNEGFRILGYAVAEVLAKEGFKAIEKIIYKFIFRNEGKLQEDPPVPKPQPEKSPNPRKWWRFFGSPA